MNPLSEMDILLKSVCEHLEDLSTTEWINFLDGCTDLHCRYEVWCSVEFFLALRRMRSYYKGVRTAEDVKRSIPEQQMPLFMAWVDYIRYLHNDSMFMPTLPEFVAEKNALEKCPFTIDLSTGEVKEF